MSIASSITNDHLEVKGLQNEESSVDDLVTRLQNPIIKGLSLENILIQNPPTSLQLNQLERIILINVKFENMDNLSLFDLELLKMLSVENCGFKSIQLKNLGGLRSLKIKSGLCHHVVVENCPKLETYTCIAPKVQVMRLDKIGTLVLNEEESAAGTSSTSKKLFEFNCSTPIEYGDSHKGLHRRLPVIRPDRFIVLSEEMWFNPRFVLLKTDQPHARVILSRPIPETDMHKFKDNLEFWKHYQFYHTVKADYFQQVYGNVINQKKQNQRKTTDVTQQLFCCPVVQNDTLELVMIQESTEKFEQLKKSNKRKKSAASSSAKKNKRNEEDEDDDDDDVDDTESPPVDELEELELSDSAVNDEDMLFRDVSDQDMTTMEKILILKMPSNTETPYEHQQRINLYNSNNDKLHKLKMAKQVLKTLPSAEQTELDRLEASIEENKHYFKLKEQAEPETIIFNQNIEKMIQGTDLLIRELKEDLQSSALSAQDMDDIQAKIVKHTKSKFNKKVGVAEYSEVDGYKSELVYPVPKFEYGKVEKNFDIAINPIKHAKFKKPKNYST